jgi:hypothetical protein
MSRNLGMLFTTQYYDRLWPLLLCLVIMTRDMENCAVAFTQVDPVGEET